MPGISDTQAALRIRTTNGLACSWTGLERKILYRARCATDLQHDRPCRRMRELGRRARHQVLLHGIDERLQILLPVGNFNGARVRTDDIGQTSRVGRRHHQTAAV